MEWLQLVWILAILQGCTAIIFNSSFTPEHIRYLRNETRALFSHGWNAYMEYGFPLDEVRPLSCEPYGPDFDDIYDVIRNDAMGNTTLMVLDNIDSLIIFEEWDQLEFVLQFLKDEKDTLFEKDTVVQVFETTIRSLGGLLSAHLLLTDVAHSGIKRNIPSRYIPLKRISDAYDGFLLDMAHDLGLKLLPAFDTGSHIPLPRVNLLKGIKGVPLDLQKDNCLSGAGSPVLEFSLLSHLTGNPWFMKYSQRTFWNLWGGKLKLGLIPVSINPLEGVFTYTGTGIGASGDSFFEYAAKSAILLQDNHMWDVFTESYKSILTHMADGSSGTTGPGGMIVPNVDADDGVRLVNYIDLLGAFWSGLQVLTGQLSDAINTHLVYLKIWNTFDLIPERWRLEPSKFANPKRVAEIDRLIAEVALEWYPLRPEFIESTYYLYRATRDPMYLQIGERILNLLRDRYKAPCGFYGIQDVRTGEKNDRMETFVLGETLKYLYMLFDVDNEVFLHSDLMNSKNWIFSTEAHPLWLGRNMSKLSVKPIGLEGNKDIPKKVKKRLKNHHGYQLERKDVSLHEQLRMISYYVPMPLSQIEYYDIPNLEVGLTKKDAFADRFYYCELSPFLNFQENQIFLTSGYYHWDGIYAPDQIYHRTLIRPSYLPDENHQIEITSTFRDIYGMVAPNQHNSKFLGQCPHAHTTRILQFYMGDRGLGSSLEISRLTKLRGEMILNTTYMKPNDLWVPDTDGLRLVFEELLAGSYDTNGRLITKEYIRRLTKHCYYDCSRVKLYRVLRIHGVDVSPNAVVWSRPFGRSRSKLRSNTYHIDANANHQLILEGVIVENWLFWQGMNSPRADLPN